MSNKVVFDQTMSRLDLNQQAALAQVLVALEGNQGANNTLANVLDGVLNVDNKQRFETAPLSSSSKRLVPAA